MTITLNQGQGSNGPLSHIYPKNTRYRDCYNNPKEFEPERFQNDNIGVDSHYYYPFWLGPRSCPAVPLAVIVWKFFIAET